MARSKTTDTTAKRGATPAQRTQNATPAQRTQSATPARRNQSATPAQRKRSATPAQRERSATPAPRRRNATEAEAPPAPAPARVAAKRNPTQHAPAEGSERISLPTPDYEAVDVLVVREPEQLRALGDDLRTRIVVLLRERAASTTELAERLALPKGTVGHHVKVLERAGLIRVVRTRKVRALTERYYGRTARLFLFKSSDDAGGEGVRDVAAASLRTAVEEMLPSPGDDRTTFAVLRARLTDADARRFARRLEKLHDDFVAAENAGGEPFGLVTGLFRRVADA